MSRLNDLLKRVQSMDPNLGSELLEEVREFTKRRTFGLVFEPHQPEAVHLPQRRVRKGDKVRVLPPRGSLDTGDKRLWRVSSFESTGEGRSALLTEIGAAEPEYQVSLVEDLVVVAEFHDRIYPGLVETGRIERGGDKPFHSVINAENFHALELLTYTHRHSIDAIFIDPPYNSGARDWKYNNDYVEKDDGYRHSKWLAFMERRLKIARDLLNPNNSVLIVTIDDKEVNRLGLLLEQLFPDGRIEMVTTVINGRGKYRKGEFARCEEYVYFIAFGKASVQGEPDTDFDEGATVPWRTLRRSDINSARGTAKGGTSQFFPIYVDDGGQIRHIGAALPHDVDRTSAPEISGCTAVFPMRDDGTEINWGLTVPSLISLHKKGYVRVGRHVPDKPQTWELSYLTSGRIEDIRSGKATILGNNRDGSVIAKYITAKEKMPVSTWVRPSHNAETQGTELLKSLLGHKSFPYPKSLYAVEDILRFFIKDKPEAVILDFFSGSGTTAHAVMRLNHQDGGRRQSISITNNEVSADEQKSLRGKNLRPGDAEWETWGICDYITKPRIKAAITGKTPAGTTIPGSYKFVDEFPLAQGFEENAAFFTLTYEGPLSVAHHRSFGRVAPVLWLRAGSQGRCIDALGDQGWDVAETYGVLENLDNARDFVAKMSEAAEAHIAYIVTDDGRAFQMICSSLPQHITPVRLYESYLTNFEINSGRKA